MSIANIFAVLYKKLQVIAYLSSKYFTIILKRFIIDPGRLKACTNVPN